MLEPTIKGNRFGEVINNTAKGGTQVVTKNDKENADDTSFENFEHQKTEEKSLSDFLLNNPARKYWLGLDLERSKDMGRPTLDFSDEIDD